MSKVQKCLFRKTLIILGLFYLSAGSVGISYSKETSQSKILFQETLERIVSETSPWTVYNFPFEVLDTNKNFQNLYKTSCHYFKDGKKLTATGKLTSKQEMVLTHAFYSLPLGGYLEWMVTVKSAYKNKKISKTMFEYVVFPALTTRPDLYLAYRQKDFSDFYSSLTNEVNLDGKRVSSVTDIVNGSKEKWLESYLPGTGRKLPSIEKSYCK